MARLTEELNNRGLKCGGSLMDRAERLFLLRSATWPSLRPKLWSSQAKRCRDALQASLGSPPVAEIHNGILVMVRLSPLC